MKKIDDQIQWYKQNSNSLYDDMVGIELEKINSLYARYEDHTDEMFVEEMIESFCKIIERQRDKIWDLETENGGTKEADGFGNQPVGHGCMAFAKNSSPKNNGIPQDGFQNDKQLQGAFTQYCLNDGKSSYTVNDYCSRIRNVWNLFYKAYKGECEENERLPEELMSAVAEDDISSGNPLLNAYNHIEELSCYISMKIAGTDGNRNWANARAAFNKFDEFKSENKYA